VFWRLWVINTATKTGVNHSQIKAGQMLQIQHENLLIHALLKGSSALTMTRTFLVDISFQMCHLTSKLLSASTHNWCNLLLLKQRHVFDFMSLSSVMHQWVYILIFLYILQDALSLIVASKSVSSTASPSSLTHAGKFLSYMYMYLYIYIYNIL